MDLLKYLEPMKNLPKRFSNLAFWRDVRKFKDEVVNAFEYVDSWGTHIEESISPLVKSSDDVKFKSLSLNNIAGFTFTYVRKTGLSGVYEIHFTKSVVELPLDKFSTNAIIIAQCIALTSTSTQDSFNIICPVLLYTENGKCMLRLHDGYNCYIPTSDATPRNINIALWYVG